MIFLDTDNRTGYSSGMAPKKTAPARAHIAIDAAVQRQLAVIAAQKGARIGALATQAVAQWIAKQKPVPA